MISTDLLEVLLRSVPQYFLFAILGLYIFSWVEKKPLFGLFAEIAAVTLGILTLIVLKSKMIPAPETIGIDSNQIKNLISLLLMLLLNGALALIALVIRINKKKISKYFSIAVFVFSIFIFFKSTNNANVNFKLTPKIELDTN